MRYRRTVKEDGKLKVVWFGSYGTDSNGKAKFVSSDKHDNFSSEQEGVKDSLLQKLSTIENELWYSITYGIPLIEKYTSRTEMDVAIMTMILEHPEVQGILNFNSTVNGRTYSCTTEILSAFGSITLAI